MQPGCKFLAEYYGAMARLLRAGVPLPRAAAAAARSSPASKAAAALAEGEPPQAAFQAAGFPGTDAMVIGLGAATGRLDAVLEDLAAHYGRVHSAGKAILAKSLYPVVVIHLAAVLLAIPPAVLAGETFRFLASAASTLGLVYAAGAVAVAAVFAALRLHASLATAAVIIEAVPVLGGWLQAATAARFASTFAMLVRAGAGPLRGLEAGGRVCRNARLRNASLRAIEDGRRGQSLARAFENVPPPAIARALDLGQTSGRLDSEMELAADELRAAARMRLERVAEWLPRILYLAVLAYVGWRIVTTALDLAQTLGRALDPGF